MKKIRNIGLGLVIAIVFFYSMIAYYPYIFSRTVIGSITAVEKVNPSMTVVAVSGDMTPQIFSYAIGIRDKKTGEIVTASSEDRQWAVAREGQCVEAQFFPYPPWNLEKWGTYYNARLRKLSDCAATP